MGTLRREFLDWLATPKRSEGGIWPLGVRHLNRLLGDFARYYNTSRPHMSLDGAVTEPPDDLLIAAALQETTGNTEIIAIPHLGGLHHEYRLDRVA